jgi:hypothetical protein
MSRRTLIACLLLFASPLANAATLVWPGPAPCAGTLQACVNAAAAGDVIVIGDDGVGNPAYTAINESIIIGQSLTLTAATGIDAVFAPSFNILFIPGVAGPHDVTISGIVLRQGSVDIRDSGSVAGSVFRVQRMRIVEPTAPNVIGCAIKFDLQSPSPQVIAGDNVIGGGDTPGELRSGICASSGAPGGSMTAIIFRNRIATGAAGLRTGIAANLPTGGGSIRVSANSVLGPNIINGIAVQRASGSATASVQVDNNVVALQTDPVGWGLQVQAGNSTAVVVNNTIAHGARGLLATGFDALPVSGRVANNLIAFHSGTGANFAAGALTNSHNLVFGNASNFFTPGPSTLTVDPLVERPGYPRPRAGSPALDAGNNADLPALALFDADGERRVVFGTVDIGAYEANGDGSARITATASTVFFNETYVTPFPVALTAGDTLVGVARLSPSAAGASSRQLGVYRNPASPSGWSLFLQDLNQLMSLGETFHLLAPLAGKTGFVHTTSAASVAGALSTLANVDLDSPANASRIAVPFHHWQGAYHDIPIGLRWIATGGGRWQLRNENGAAMPVGQTFNIAVAPPLSPNAFRATSPTAAARLRLEHPLLDGNDCAAPVVGRVDDPELAGDVLNPVPFGLVYLAPSGPGAPGRWMVQADAPVGTPPIPAQASFNVIIDGAQANGCRAPVVELVFSNGFE